MQNALISKRGGNVDLPFTKVPQELCTDPWARFSSKMQKEKMPIGNHSPKQHSAGAKHRSSDIIFGIGEKNR